MCVCGVATENSLQGQEGMVGREGQQIQNKGVGKGKKVSPPSTKNREQIGSLQVKGAGQEGGR